MSSAPTNTLQHKLRALNIKQLSDTELLSLIIQKRSQSLNDALTQASAYLSEFADLRALFNASKYHWHAGAPMDKHTTTRLRVLTELQHRLEKKATGSIHRFDSTIHTVRFLHEEYKDEIEEVFGCLFLNTKHQLIHFEKIFRGGIAQVHVHPRVILRYCLQLGAAHVVLVHNHPSGDVTPSRSDISTTQALKKAIRYIDVSLIDHVIIAGTQHYSFAEHGKLTAK